MVYVTRYFSKTIKSKLSTSCILLTGLSGSGKTTLGRKLLDALKKNNVTCVLLDGDNLRNGLNSNLRFSRSDRKENARRVAEVAKLFLAEDTIVIITIIAPFHEDRVMMKNIIGIKNFFMFYIECPLEICKNRDVKGLYQQVELGLLTDFTGISSAYEIPQDFDLKIDTANITIDNNIDTMLYFLIENEFNNR